MRGVPHRVARGLELMKKTIQQRFEEFDKARPQVYDALLEFTLQAYYAGAARIGIGELYERVRWHFRVERKMGEEFKLNNIYRSRYARKLMDEYPDLVGIFELRTLKTD
jgi:hypothetical protein